MKVFLLLFLSLNLFALPRKCSGILADTAAKTKTSLKSKTIAELMAMDEPIRLGKDAILTYSHDTEISAESWVNYIYKDKQGTKELDELIGPLTSESLVQDLGMSKSEIREDALREDATLKVSTNKISSLEPEYAAQVIGAIAVRKDKVDDMINDICVIFKEVAERKKHDMQIDLDGKAIELAHKSYESTPKGLVKIIDWLFTEFNEPSAHLHIGLPVSEISIETASTIASVLETIVLLDRATYDYDTLNPLAYHSGSPLVGRHYRGPIYLKNGLSTDKEYKGFTKPKPAHDLEIREYADKKMGLLLMGLASKLAVNAKDLKPNDKIKYGSVDYKMPHMEKLGNITGALQFASEKFASRRDKESKKIAEELQNFAYNFDNPDLTQTKHKELKAFLIKNKILERLKEPALYLEQ